MCFEFKLKNKAGVSMEIFDTQENNFFNFTEKKGKNETKDKVDQLINLVTQVTNMVCPVKQNSG